jgi:Domain of unknown function (DUF4340)
MTLTWVVVVLVASERLLALIEHHRRDSTSRLRRLIPANLLEGKPVAAIRVEDTATGSAVLIARASGGWLCLSHWGAPADEARLQSVVGRILNANGIARPATQERLAAYGLEDRQTVRVSLHGPQVLEAANRDVIAVVEIGAAFAGGRGTYARLGRSAEVIAIDDDLRQDLVAMDPRGPMPLVESRIVPGSWSAGLTIERVEVRPDGAPPFELRKRPRDAKQEDVLAGRLPWDWVLFTASAERVVTEVAEAFIVFLQHVTHRSPIDPRPLRALGLDPPRARVVLHPDKGTALELQLGGPTVGGIAVRNAQVQSVYVVDSETAPLIVPRADSFRASDQGNAWGAALRNMMPLQSPR